MPRKPRGQPLFRMMVSLPPETVSALRELAESDGVTVAELIRQATRAFIEGRRPAQ